MDDKKLVDALLKIYNDIDAFLRRQPWSDKYADHSYLIQEGAKNNRVVARYESELKAIAQLRNSLVHNPISNVSPIAYPNDVLVKLYGSIRDQLLMPRLASSISINASQIYTANPQSLLHKVLKTMDDNIYTHVPIIEDDKMVGVFSENTLLSYLADNQEAIILKDVTINDFKKYLPLKAHKGESFEFLARNAKLADAYDIFNKAIKAHRRIGMLFITEHGKEYEKPLGIITAWDLASPSFGQL